MKLVRLFGGIAALCAFVAVAVLYATVPARSFDLQGTPALVSRPTADITDTYLFPSPTNTQNVVVVMDVDPGLAQPLGATPSPSTSAFFDQTVLYTMKFDTNYGSEAAGARPKENLVLQFSFGEPTGTVGNQTQGVSVFGPLTPTLTGTTTKLVNGGTAQGTGFFNRSFSFDTGQIEVFAGVRADPQFFDYCDFQKIFAASAAPNAFAACSTVTANSSFAPGPNPNTFAQSNVLSIVVELPRSLLQNAGSGTVAYWATTSTPTGK